MQRNNCLHTASVKKDHEVQCLVSSNKECQGLKIICHDVIKKVVVVVKLEPGFSS